MVLKNIRRRTSARFAALVKEGTERKFFYNGWHRYRKALGDLLSIYLGEEKNVFHVSWPNEGTLSIQITNLEGKGFLLTGFPHISGEAERVVCLNRLEKRGLQVVLEEDTAGEEEEGGSLFADSFFTRVPFELVVTDFQGKIIEWSHRVEVLTGWKVEEVMGKFYCELQGAQVARRREFYFGFPVYRYHRGGS